MSSTATLIYEDHMTETDLTWRNSEFFSEILVTEYSGFELHVMPCDDGKWIWAIYRLSGDRQAAHGFVATEADAKAAAIASTQTSVQ